MMKPTEENRFPSGDASGIDAALRRALEPEAATVDRLVRGALAERESPVPFRRPAFRRPASRHWRLAAVAAVVAVLAVLALPILLPTVPEEPPAPNFAARSPADGADTPTPLRISNEHGPVTVTTPAGSKMVFLPFFPGDS